MVSQLKGHFHFQEKILATNMYGKKKNLGDFLKCLFLETCRNNINFSINFSTNMLHVG